MSMGCHGRITKPAIGMDTADGGSENIERRDIVCSVGSDCDDSIDCTVDTCEQGGVVCVNRAPDRDGDGHADAQCLDALGRPLGDDCDDTRVDRRPSQPEFCDGVDNDCDGATDEDTEDVPWYPDKDGDGFGVDESPELSCVKVPGASILNTDCDDLDRERHPGQQEVCDGLDNDCNGAMDELAECTDEGQETPDSGIEPDDANTGPVADSSTEADSSATPLCDGDFVNACNGCDVLVNEPGEECGPCGLDSFICDGQEATRCSGSTYANDCNGCSVLANEPGEPCGSCGLDSYECDGFNNTICSGDTLGNSCGGCSVLTNQPGTSCGPCNFDTYICSGENNTACDGTTYGNACNGCSDLDIEPGIACGPCDLDEYICDASGGTICSGVTYGGDCTRPDDVPDEAYFDPVVDWDPDWVAFEQEVLDLVNQYRSEGADCGSEGQFSPTDPLVMEPRLRGAARLHSKDMAERDFFSHTNPDGLDPFERMLDAGYTYQLAGENIASNQMSPEEVMGAWMSSDGHCANIMNPNFVDIGIGYFEESGTNPWNTSRLWTQNFGKPLL